MANEKPKIDSEKYGVKKTDDGYKVDAKSLIASVGGVQGFIEATVPGLVYVLSFAIWQDLTISIVSVSIAMVALIIRHFLAKRPASALLGPVLGIALAIYLAQRPEGQPRDFYLTGFVTNAAYGGALLLSVLVRFPLIGVLVGFMTDQGLRWRKERRKVRFFNLVTWLWVAFFASRLLVQVPMYLANDVVSLGFTRIVMGTPYFLMMIWISWLLLRKVVSAKQDGILEK
jgi:MFS family permease